ncbi:MAG: InlB B-repeat-containing protein [Anaerovoracaceae bacterium]
MKLKNKWKALVQGAILLVMLILAGTVVFASEFASESDGTLKIDVYGPLHVTKIWLDNDAEEMRPEEVYLARDDFFQYKKRYGKDIDTLNTMLENSPENLWKSMGCKDKLTADDNWEITFPSGIFSTYLVEIAPPEGYDQIMWDESESSWKAWEWKFYDEGMDGWYDYWQAYHNTISYVGYNGVRQLFFVNRLENSNEPLTTYKVTYEDGAQGSIFQNNMHEGIPAGGITPLFTGNKVSAESEEEERRYDYYAEPARDGYTFMGWKEADETEFSRTVTKDTTYIAQWEKGTKYRVTYNDGVEEEVIFEDEVNRGYDSNADTPAFRGDTGKVDTDDNNNTIPVREGYKFTGWKDAAGNDWSANVDGNVTYYAQWEKVWEPTISGGSIVIIQKPVIEGDAGAAWTLSSDGTKVTISAKEGYTLADVTLNGTSKGQAAELTGLKTGDKVVISTVNDADVLAEKLAAVKLVARSKMSAANGKAAIKVYWYAEDGSDISFDGYEVFRSTKRYSGFGKTPIFETDRETYWNTAIKSGTTYYYKVRGYIERNGERYYTGWSLKAIRSVK